MKDSTLLVPSKLPGATTLDTTLVEETLLQIQELHTEGAIATALAVGRRVLANFFDSDSELYERTHREHLSFRELARRPELPFHPKYLYRSVRLVEQLRLLPDVLSEQLHYSHQLELLPLRDPGTKLQLAERAVAEGWSVVRLRAAVREARGVPEGSGRRAKPAIHKGVKTAIRGFEQALEGPLEGPEFSDYTDQQGRALIEALDELFDKYQATRPQWVERFGER